MPSPKALNGLHVLVVEDNEDARELARALLMLYGAHVSVAAGAEEALAFLERNRVDCIISDISMPGRDGLWFISQLRARDGGRPIPAIAVTALVGPEHRRTILAAGFQVHMPKPIGPDDLVDAVHHAVGRSRAGASN